MLMELIRDNTDIADRITHKDIRECVKLLKINHVRDSSMIACIFQTKANYTCSRNLPNPCFIQNCIILNLLSVLFVCDGISLPRNQCYIADFLTVPLFIQGPQGQSAATFYPK